MPLPHRRSTNRAPWKSSPPERHSRHSPPPTGNCKGTAMLEAQVIVKVREGLHARPAVQFAKLAREFDSALKIGRGDTWADAKSAVKLILLGVKHDNQIMLRAQREDEREAIDRLTRCLSDAGAMTQGPADQGAPAVNGHGPATRPPDAQPMAGP